MLEKEHGPGMLRMALVAPFVALALFLQILGMVIVQIVGLFDMSAAGAVFNLVQKPFLSSMGITRENADDVTTWVRAAVSEGEKPDARCPTCHRKMGP